MRESPTGLPAGRSPADRPSTEGFPADRPSTGGSPADRAPTRGSPADRPPAGRSGPIRPWLPGDRILGDRILGDRILGERFLIERFLVAEEVRQALVDRLPVVALESTLISHGLPAPDNLQVARESEAAVRQAGAVPATVAVIDGILRIGLTDNELVALATRPTIAKVSRSGLAAAIASGGWGATTVSATMTAAALAGIQVMATGGIGGVHPGAYGVVEDGDERASSIPAGARRVRGATLDVSADLDALADLPLAVVCSGPKAILDVPLTLEYLETRGVPVVTVGQEELPGFYCRSSGVPSPLSVPDLAAASRVASVHLALGAGGILVAVPVPADAALDPGVAAAAVAEATAEAQRQGIGGGALTPWLLARIAEITGGASLRANQALIVANARAAGELAAHLAG
jgi:pseudouridine-5'-phosphate glycosidase